MSVDANGLVEDLTKREREVLELMVQTHSNREISNLLNVSIETVRTHTKRIYAKLNVSGRQEASFRAIQLGLVDDPITPDIPSQTNLYATYDFFVGREDELSALADLFARGEQFVSVVGVGGMGKTRLAIEFAQHQQKYYPNGVYLIELESVQDRDGIILQIAESLFINLTGSKSPADQVCEYLANKHLLLIVDNCEHLVDELDFLVDILNCAMDIRIITTSRVRLNLSREVVYNLRGLSIPDDDSMKASGASDAIQLMLRFAQRTQLNWTVTDLNRHAVYELCRVTRGMPLAIMLAVGWLDTYPLERIVVEIQRNIDFLETDLRDMPDRHRSMRAVFDWTWKLLADIDRDVLMKFSVFSNGATLDATEKITGATPTILKSLISKALLQRDATGRYSIHPLLRQYSGDQLKTSSNISQEIYNAHADYYIATSEDIMTNKLYGEQVKAELDNLYTAWHWLVITKKIDSLWQCVNTYGFVAYQVGNLREIQKLYDHAIEELELIDNPQLLGTLCYVNASLLSYISMNDASDIMLKRGHDYLHQTLTQDHIPLEIVYGLYHMALAIRRIDFMETLRHIYNIIDRLETDNLADNVVGQTMLAYAYSQIPTIYNRMENIDKAEGEKRANQALVIARRINHRFLIAFSTQLLGQLAYYAGEIEIAMNHFRSSYEAYEGLLKNYDYILMLTYLGDCARQLGYDDDIRQFWYEALLLCRDHYHYFYAVRTLILSLIQYKIELGDLIDATQLIGFCAKHATIAKDRNIIKEHQHYLQNKLDDEQFQSVFLSGQALSYEIVIRDILIFLED